MTDDQPASAARDNGAPITIWPPTSITQDARDRLKELIRMGGIRWRRDNAPDYREGKTWMDGVLVDLDESDVLNVIVDCVIEHADPAPEETA